MKVSARPTAGARLAVELADESPARVIYRGFLHLPSADVPAEVTVALPGGPAVATLGEGGTADLAKAAAALVRVATRGAAGGGERWPRKIVRWRA